MCKQTPTRLPQQTRRRPWLGRPRRAVLATALALLGASLWLGLGAGLGIGGQEAHACVFLRTPHAYEADRERATYLAALDAASVDALFPGDAAFGLPAIEVGTRANRAATPQRQIPVSLLRSIAWVESGLTMASRSVPFQSGGLALVSFDCGHGIMQVTTGMTVPLGSDEQASAAQISIATHYAHNIARGAAILADKWNQAPQLRPIVGTDTNSNPALIENWYYAVWSYNGFTGPGSNRSNHPADLAFGGWPRASYQCDGRQSRNRYPYQELVWGCLASPPQVAGRPLWQPVAATLPNLGDPRYFQALSIGTFALPYAGMDMPTPQPAHQDAPPQISPSYRLQTLAAPKLSVSAPPLVIRTDGPPSAARLTIQVRNDGSGILSWAALPSDSWLVVDPPAGVALGGEVPCAPGDCDRVAELTLTVNPTLLPAAAASGVLRITSPNGTGPPIELRVSVEADFEVGAPGTSRAN